MCTAVTYKTKDFYFGRNLDLDYTYNEKIVITARNFSLKFRNQDTIDSHFAIIGMAIVVEDYPLYYDAMNEKGLCMAGLSVPHYAQYKKNRDDADNVASFEFIPWVLAQCKNLDDVKHLIKNLNITDTPFNSDFLLSPLHWIIADRTGAITVEAVGEGIKIYDNNIGILTNSPEFDAQMINLNNYMGLSAEQTEHRISNEIDFKPYTKGMGAIGLPGDLSSMSRFVKVAFTKLNSVSGEEESESVGQFFHILGSVYQQRGCVKTGEDKYEITYYSSCCNADKGIYYYTTYFNPGVCAVSLFMEKLDSDSYYCYPLVKQLVINMQNR